MPRERWFYVVLGISFFLSLLLTFGIDHPVDDTSDAHGYDKLALNLSQGNGYVDEDLRLTMNREPAYPFFLAFVYLAFGHSYAAVKFLQILLFLGTVILTYSIADMVFGRRIAMYSMIATAFFPTLMSYPSYILSETLFTFLLSLFVFFCLKACVGKKLVYYVLSGAALGSLILCKAIMLPFIVVLFLWGVLFCKETAKTILMVFICVGIILPWMYRNYKHFNTFSLREGSALALCIKAQKLDYGPEDFKKAIIFTISEQAGKKMFPDSVKDPRDFLFKEDMLARERILPELKKEGYGDEEINRMMMNRIKKRPLKFLAVSFLDLLKLSQFSYFPVLNQANVIEKFHRLPNGRAWLSLLRAGFRSIAGLLILFSIIGMYIKRTMWKKWIFLVIIISYPLIIYDLIYGNGRYMVPFIPYFVIFSMPAVFRIKEKVVCKYAKV